MPVGLRDADVRRIPAQLLTAGEAAAMQCACAVCLELLCGGQRAKRLPACSHTFHAHCIDSWIKTASSCPVCRERVTVEAGPDPPDPPLTSPS
jgi:E3 ubiquitin-protein ligase RNF38/44